MALFLLECEFPVLDPPEGSEEEPYNTPDSIRTARECFIHSGELFSRRRVGEDISQALASYLKIANVLVDTVGEVCEIAGEW